MSKFTTIKSDFSTVRRLPRLGKVRLGIKVLSAKGVEYPKDVEYFVCPDEVKNVYGNQPRELDVMLPSEDLAVVFPQKLVLYRSSGLWCHGDRETAERYDDKTKKFEARTCPCDHLKTDANPKGDCDETASLMVVLPKVNLGGVYQITTHSFFGVVAINSGIDYVRFLIGRVSWVPLKLRRVPQEMMRDGKKITKWTLQLIFDGDITVANKLRDGNQRLLETARYQIEGPSESPPQNDAVDLVETEEEVMPVPPATAPSAPPPVPPVEPVAPAPVEDRADTETLPLPLGDGDTEPLLFPPDKPATPGAPWGTAEDMTDSSWELWHGVAARQADIFAEAKRSLNIPEGRSINKSIRREFRRVFEDINGRRSRT